MNQAYGLPPRRGRRRGGMFLSFVLSCLLAFSFLVIGAAAAWFVPKWLETRPNEAVVPPHFGGLDKPIIFRNEALGLSAIGEGDGLALPLGFLQEHIDPGIFVEESGDSIIVTTDDKVIRFQSEQLTAFVNGEPMELRFPVTEQDGELYVPVAPLAELYGLHLEISEETGAVFVRLPGELVQKAVVRDMLEGEQARKHDPEAARVPMRTGPDITEPVAVHLEPGEEVLLLGEEESAPMWYRVMTKGGFAGYVEKDRIRLLTAEVLPVPERRDRFIPWKPIGGKINLTWEHVVSRTADPSGFGHMPGLNVVSPTWYSLKKDKNGQFYINNLTSPSYIQWAHNRGYQVWALFSNDFDPDLTSEALASHETRMQLIRQLVSFVEMYNLQGINIDFENVYLKDKDKVTQFVREMTPFLHEAGAVVSIDVTIRGGSEMWSLFLDREELGKVVDYMIVMTYDEHWASSPKAGSVASLPWVEKGITDIMKYDHVPASKLLVGVPFYTYVWTEETTKDGVKVSSRARSMEFVPNLIREKGLVPEFLEDTGQHYVEYQEGPNTKVRIWIEDAVSMKARAELVRKYDLAGIASWRRGFETPDIWETIRDVLERRP